MRVLCLDGKQDLKVKDFPMPECREGFALVKMTKCGICGSDLTAYSGVNPTVRYPIDGLGHEGVGVISEIMDAQSELKVGDRVALEPYVPCLKCEMCQQERFNNCASLQVCGVHTGGMMSEYFLHPVRLLHKLPDSLSDTEACLIEPFTIGLHALTRGAVAPGDRVVIFGAGTIGLLAALGAKIYGATPVLVDIVERRLAFAKRAGVDHVINSREGDLPEALMRVFDGRLPNVMIDCTGSQAVLQNFHDYVAHGSRVVLVGWPHERVSVNQVRCMQKELSIFASRNSNKKFPESMRYINERRIPVERFISAEVDFDGIEACFLDMMAHPENYVKSVVAIP